MVKNIEKNCWKKRRQFNYETEVGGAFQFCRGQGGKKKLTLALAPHQTLNHIFNDAYSWR